MKNLDLTSLYEYRRENGATFIGCIVDGTLDGGDYGITYTVDLLQPNEEILYSVPVSKLKEITIGEYEDIRDLQY